MYCPARRSPAQSAGRARTDYAACVGHGSGSRESPPTAGAAAFAGLSGLIIRTGAGHVRHAHVTDGLSKTVMFGEKQTNPKDFSTPFDENETYASAGWADTEVRRVGNRTTTPQPDREHPSLTGGAATASSSRFGSSHPAGVCFVWGDGSTRWISYAVDPVSFERACRRDDGQLLSTGDL
jgi:hypothetical protein